MLTSKHYSEIRRVVHATVGENDDLVQEIAIKLAPQIDSLDHSTDLGPWIRSASRVMVRRYRPTAQMTGALPRTRGAGRVYSANQKNVELTEFSGSTKISDEHLFVRDAVSRLPEDDKQFTLLHIWGDMTLEETGAKLGMSKWAAIRRWNNHILPQLREALSEDSV